MKTKNAIAFIASFMMFISSITTAKQPHAKAIYKEYNHVIELAGDINKDGKYGISDLIAIKNYLHNTGGFNSEIMGKVDVNFDEVINIADYILMKSYILYGCEDTVNNDDNPSPAVFSPDFSNLIRKTEKFDVGSFNHFVADFADTILLDTESKNENPVYSPLSVYMALSMEAEVAEKNKVNELFRVLNVESTENLRRLNKDLFETLYLDKNTEHCKISNSVWINRDYGVNKEVLKEYADSYYAFSFVEDFSSSQTGQKISDWISKNTSDKFNPKIKTEPTEWMKIINAISFREKWTTKFQDVTKDDFNTVSGEKITCDFLKNIIQDKVGIGEHYMKYSVNMEDNFKMNFILPDEKVSIEEIVSDKEAMMKIINDDVKYKYGKVVFSVPKFDVTSTYDLTDAVRELGVDEVFSEQMNSEFFKYIISHGATLAIDEEGCQAAAYTEVDILPPGLDNPPKPETFYFELVRPFIYYVSDDNGIPVIFGLMNNPIKN